MSFQDEIDRIVKAADSKVADDKHGTVVKRLSLTTEQKAQMKAMRDAAKESVKQMAKADTLRKNFWSDIEIQSGLYANNMRYDEATGEIIVYESLLDSES